MRVSCSLIAARIACFGRVLTLCRDQRDSANLYRMTSQPRNEKPKINFPVLSRLSRRTRIRSYLGKNFLEGPTRRPNSNW